MSFSDIAKATNQGISNGRSFLDNKVNSILKPKSAEGISGFLFDVPDTEQVTLQSDITDHYTENNSFLNDHITNKPITVTLSGFVGELVFETPSGIGGVLQTLENRLGTVGAYLGDLTPGAIQTAQRAVQKTKEVVSEINKRLDQLQNVVGFFSGDSASSTRQGRAAEELRSLWESKELVTVQTPWFYYENMIIQAITFTQDSATSEITDISVTLKEIRIAETKIIDFSTDQFPVREQVQAAAEEDQGVVRGSEGELSSTLFRITQ